MGGCVEGAWRGVVREAGGAGEFLTSVGTQRAMAKQASLAGFLRTTLDTSHVVDPAAAERRDAAPPVQTAPPQPPLQVRPVQATLTYHHTATHEGVTCCCGVSLR